MQDLSEVAQQNIVQNELKTVDRQTAKEYKDSKLKQMEKDGSIRFEVISNDGTDRCFILLTGAKNIFQKQLPKMPKEYITRLVYDKKHSTLLIIKNNSIYNLIGAITYRTFTEEQFVEIVFCAVSSDEQVQGYGSFMMNHLKEHVKRCGQTRFFLTYADNYAVGYFKKQGFTKEITLSRDIWGGRIKDYDGGTLMLCSMLPKIDYNETFKIIDLQRQAIMEKLRIFTDAYTRKSGKVVFQRLQEKRRKLSSAPSTKEGFFSNIPSSSLSATLTSNEAYIGNTSTTAAPSQKSITKLNPEEIPGVMEAGWTDEMLKFSELPRKSKLYEVTRPLLTELQNHASSWPFLQPVNRLEVPDYYNVIKDPMDFSLIDDRVESERYRTLDEFVHDVMLIFSNCKTFNDPSTQYYKCAERMEEFFSKRITNVAS